MNPLSRALLLLTLLGLSAAQEGCKLPEKVQAHEMSQLLDVPWILVEAFSDYAAGTELLKMVNSSRMELKTTHDNKTFLFDEKNIVGGKCHNFRLNMSISDPTTSNHSLYLSTPGVQEQDGVESPYDDQGRAIVFQSSPDGLIVIYSGVFVGTPGKMLLIYRREGKLDADELKASQTVHRDLAQCLLFLTSSHFRYDGKSEFCVEKKEQTDA